MNTAPDKYNPNRIIEAAHEKLQQDNDWQGGQLLFQTALLQWSDDARESTLGDDGSGGLREALATLYMAYAQYLATAKQFKSTMEAYESATADPVVRGVGRVWLEYGAYCQERQKYVKAQDVYLRALVGSATDNSAPAVTDPQDCDVLWQAFWEMVKEQNDKPDMTLEELQTAVLAEHGGAGKSEADEPAQKRIKLEHDDGGGLPLPPLPMQTTPPQPPTPMHDTTKVHVVVPETVQTQQAHFLQVLQQPDLPPEIRGAWIMVDGGTGPAQPPEPPLFQPSPPKLTDPSGKDVLGVELALALTRQLLKEQRGSLLLQTCRALWVMTAVQERAAADRLGRLDAEWQQTVADKEAEFASRRSVATDAQLAAAVDHIMAQERQALHQHVGQQRQQVLQELAWQSRRLLCAQQVILQKFQVPTFEDGPTVDPNRLEWQAKVCSYLHSAFYLRNRIGEATHTSMLQSQCKKLEKEQEQLQQEQPPGPPPEDTNAMYNNQPGGYYPPPQMHPPPPPPPQQQQGYGQPPPGYGGGYQPYPGMMQPPSQPYGGPPPPPPPPPPGSYPYHR